MGCGHTGRRNITVVDRPSRFDLDAYYDEFPRIEEDFQDALDQSLHPRGPGMLYDLVAGLGLPATTSALDVGCGEGRHALMLAARFGFSVRGLDPVERHLSIAAAALAEAARSQPELRDRVRFGPGAAEDLPVDNDSVDLIWCRDVLVHVADLDRAYGEFRRVLRREGRVLVYQMFGTDRLEPREGKWLFNTMGVVPLSADPRRTEDAIASSGLRINECLELGPEWGEYAEENDGQVSRQLLHAARLRRDPARYTAQYGPAAYDIMMGDCLWHVYRMIGKLSPRIYLLSVRNRG